MLKQSQVTVSEVRLQFPPPLAPNIYQYASATDLDLQSFQSELGGKFTLILLFLPLKQGFIRLTHWLSYFINLLNSKSISLVTFCQGFYLVSLSSYGFKKNHPSFRYSKNLNLSYIILNITWMVTFWSLISTKVSLAE